MKKVISFPFLRAGDECFESSGWLDDQGRDPFPEGMLRTWDPNKDLCLTRIVRADTRRILANCRLGKHARLRIGCSWESAGTSVRDGGSGPASVALSLQDAATQKKLEMKIPGGLLRGSVHLHASCVVVEPDSNDPLAPRQKGSLIWRTSQEVFLEGSGARFPIELQRFPENEKFAGWSLSITDDLEWPFLGGVQLLVNDLNGAIHRAVGASEPSDVDQLIRSTIYYDIGRQLVAKAVASGEFVEKFDLNRNVPNYPENSVGRALWALVTTFFPDKSAAELNRLRVADPPKFEALMQHRFRIFGAIRG